MNAAGVRRWIMRNAPEYQLVRAAWLEDLQGSRVALEVERDGLVIVRETLRHELDEAQRTYRNDAEVEDLVDQADGLRRRVDEVTRERDAATADVVRLRGAVDELRGQLDAVRTV